MKIKSSFKNKSFMPKKYSYNNGNISPQLEIYEIPKNAVSLVLILEDPDAPVKSWVHWVVWNIKVFETELKINENQKNFGVEGKMIFKK